MDCSCRTAALRIFVKSVAQIHVPLRTATPRVTQYHTLHGRAIRPRNQRVGPAATIASRALHTSCVRHGTAAPAQAAPEQVEASTHHGGDAKTNQTRSRRTADRASDVGAYDARVDTASSEGHEPTTADPAPEPKKKAKISKRDKDQRRHGLAYEVDESRYPPKEPKEPWRIQKDALKKKFPGGWNPRKKLSPDALVGIRMLHQQFPDEYTTEVLAKKFEVSPEAIRRILKSKWEPEADEEQDRQERWFNRGKQVWTHWAALGKKPPRKWRAEGVVRDPYWNKPRGPNHKDKDERAAAQRRLAKSLLG